MTYIIESHKTSGNLFFAMIVDKKGNATEMLFADLADAQAYIDAINAFIKS